MPRFHVADLNAQGEIQLEADYAYEELEQLPGAGELIGLFSGEIWRSPEEFVAKLEGGLSLRLNSPSATTAIATLRQADEKLLSISLLLTGINADADQVTLGALQTHLLRELHGTPFEAGFALMQMERRPLVASVHLGAPEDRGLARTFALCDRCLAAAYFRYHRLA